MTRALIVDDKPENLYLLRALLQGHGYQVDEARHGAEALVRARLIPPDVVVSDLLMPVMDGYTLLRQWKADERFRQIPFVVYTATYTDPKDEKLAFDLGADAFILKPADPEVFLARIREVLAAESGALAREAAEGEEVLLKEYSETLVRKLEDKARELEETNRALKEEIAERQAAQVQAEAARHLLKEVFDRVTDAFVALDREWRYIYVNRRAGEIFGRRPEDLIGKHIWTEFPEGIGQPFHRAYERAMGEQTPIRMEDYYPPYDRWFENIIYPSPEGVSIYFHDITDRKRAEEALRESEEGLRLALDAARMGTFDWDIRNDRITWSRWHEELWGYERGEFDGTFAQFAERVHPDDLPGIDAEIRRCIAAWTAWRREFRVLWPDGSVHWITGQGEFTFDESGQAARMRGVVMETTERKRAEAALRESEARLRLILDGLGPQVFVALLDQNGLFLFVNLPSLKAAGVAHEAIAAKYLWEHRGFSYSVAAQERAKAALERARNGEQVRYDEQVLVAGDQLMWIDLSLQPLRDESGRVTFIVASGLVIDERKHAEQRLQESGQQLRALLARFQQAREEERIRISREIHDELGQVLTGLKMDVRWLERKLSDPALPREVNPLVDRLVATSELVDTAIVTVQTIAAELRSGVLDRLGLEAALTEEASRFQERVGIRCRVTTDTPLPTIPADIANELFYICQEALTNVARHSGAANVEILLSADGDGVVLELRDDGVGITDADLAASTSLGLLGMRERAALCGGTIVFERNDPRGTRVAVRIPYPPAATKDS